MNTEYSIKVWDVQFVKVDEDGEPLTDNKGNIQLFFENSTFATDYSDIEESIDPEELMEIKA